MFSIKIKDKIVEHCKIVLETTNFGKRSHSNGTPEQQLRGIVAQSVVQNICGFGLVDGKGGFDGGKDLMIGEYSCDVKTMKRTTYPKLDYVGNFPSCQLYLKTDVLIFTSTNIKTDVLTICGWIPKDEFKEKMISCKKGMARKRDDGEDFVPMMDNCEICYKYLRPVYDTDHMMNQIYMAWKPKGEWYE